MQRPLKQHTRHSKRQKGPEGGTGWVQREKERESYRVGGGRRSLAGADLVDILEVELPALGSEQNGTAYASSNNNTNSNSNNNIYNSCGGLAYTLYPVKDDKLSRLEVLGLNCISLEQQPLGGVRRQPERRRWEERNEKESKEE